MQFYSSFNKQAARVLISAKEMKRCQNSFKNQVFKKEIDLKISANVRFEGKILIVKKKEK